VEEEQEEAVEKAVTVEVVEQSPVWSVKTWDSITRIWPNKWLRQSMYEDLENEYVCNKIGYSIMRR
jgi:hypothetical protein